MRASILLLLVLASARPCVCNVTQTVTNQNNNFNGVLCSGDPGNDPIVQISFTNLSPTVSDLAPFELNLKKVNSSFSMLISNSVTTGPFSNIAYTITLHNNSIETRINSDGSRTENFDRTDGRYYIVATYPGTDGQPIIMTLPTFDVQEGLNPKLRITKENETISNFSQYESFFNILKDCVNDDPRLRVNPFQCGTDGFRLIIQEINGFTGAAIGVEINRVLTSSERSSLITSAGFPLKGFSDNTTTLNLTPGKFFNITLVYVGQGAWKPTFATMHYKAGDWDLVIWDNNTRNSYEPLNQYDDDVFGSKLLWNKKSTSTDPNSATLENPTFASLPNNHNLMFAKVENVGCAASPADVDLRLYWTIARTDELFSDHWLYTPGNQISINLIFQPGGSEITIASPTQVNPYNTNSSPFKIPSVLPQSTYTIPWTQGVKWYPPNPQYYKDASLGGGATNARPSICLLARINDPMSQEDPIVWEPTGTTDKILPYAKNNNNVATRNTVLYDDPNFLIAPNNYHYGTSTVVVNNSDPSSRNVNLCLDRIMPVSPLTFLNRGYVEIFVTNSIQSLWVSGGMQSTNLVITGTNSFRVTNDEHACLNNITLPANYKDGQIGARFVTELSKPLPMANEYYEFQISQLDNTSNTTGSNTLLYFDIEPTRPQGVNGGQGGGVANLNIDQSSGTIGLTVYPNPAGDKFRLSLTGSTNKTFDKVEIVNLNGAVVKTFENISSDFEYNMTGFSTGLYFIKVTSGDTHQVLKLQLQ
jgi:hypothetical protein